MRHDQHRMLMDVLIDRSDVDAFLQLWFKHRAAQYEVMALCFGEWDQKNNEEMYDTFSRALGQEEQVKSRAYRKIRE